MNVALFSQLPSELLDQILSHLKPCELHSLCLVSRTLYHRSTPHLWSDVLLTDRSSKNVLPSAHGTTSTDDHDDTPMIHLLITLASNPRIASCVTTLTHQCHLPPPSNFDELPVADFHSRSLSIDPRTLKLLELACVNLTSVRTLRIIFGHYYITQGLLSGLLKQGTSVRRLWLENSGVSAISNSLLKLGSGLQSIRIRRIHLTPEAGAGTVRVRYARRGNPNQYNNYAGGLYTTTDEWSVDEDTPIVNIRNACGDPNSMKLEHAVQEISTLLGPVMALDDRIYEEIYTRRPDIPSETTHLYDTTADRVLYAINPIPAGSRRASDHHFPYEYASLLHVFQAASHSLTSLNLDWLLCNNTPTRSATVNCVSVSFFRELFKLRFPCLKAFQFRNCVTRETQLPSGLYLLDRCGHNLIGEELGQEEFPPGMCIDFMNAHPLLECLAWPMDRYLRPGEDESGYDADRSFIDRLRQKMTDLRVDYMHDPLGEPHTARHVMEGDDSSQSQKSRRRFIAEFASCLQNVKCLKLEGGSPQDEKRETLRALSACPLEKVVIIGVNWPLANTWGPGGLDLMTLDPTGPPNFMPSGGLGAEDEGEIARISLSDSQASYTQQPFIPYYGEQSRGHLLHMIASQHAETITELKFCGYHGSPVLWTPLPITTYILRPLRKFHRLRKLVTSLWLHTIFEGAYSDAAILSYWQSTQSPSSTALVVTGDAEENSWATELETKYKPERIAWRVADLLGSFLSERAKAAKGGVHIRASFYLGSTDSIDVHDVVYDWDVWVGKAADGEDKVLSWKGPREELHPERQKEKLESRRWF